MVDGVYLVVKDRVSSWFMRNVIKPRMERIDQAGYITTSVGEISDLRECFVPEDILVELENLLEEEKGDEGARTLYQSGKEFGQRYAEVSEFPQIGDSGKIRFKKFFDFFVKYIETTYASNLSYQLDLDSRQLRIDAEDYVVCRKNGKGYILTEGAVAGVMAYMFSTEALDAKHSSCQGLGSENCKVRCEENLRNLETNTNPRMASFKKYRAINEVRELKHANESMQDLLDSGFFNYEKGHLSFEDQRYVLFEACLLDIIDSYLEELDLREEGFRAGFRVGRSVAEGKEFSFVEDIVAALGFGGIKVRKSGAEVMLFSYPWNSYIGDSELSIFRGFLSGMVSEAKEEEVRYRLKKKKKSDRGLRIKVEAEELA